jgi:hypothetical protein
MELCKTKCNDCGHLNRYYAYKWVDREERREWNRKNRYECVKCGSKNVVDVADDEVMAPYNFLADIIGQAVKEKK